MGNKLEKQYENAQKTGAISLTDKKLKKIPDEVWGLKDRLRVLEISNTRVEALPRDIAKCPNVKTLRLPGNRLGGVPDELGSLSKLEVLFLQDNRIESLPGSLAALSALKQVRIDGNLLTSFPAQLCPLQRLSSINLAKNKISTIPPEVGQMPALVELDLDDNLVTAIPEEIADAPRLKVLRLSRNKLTIEGIPDRVLAESQIHTLTMDGNTDLDERMLRELPGYTKYEHRASAIVRKREG